MFTRQIELQLVTGDPQKTNLSRDGRCSVIVLKTISLEPCYFVIVSAPVLAEQAMNISTDAGHTSITLRFCGAPFPVEVCQKGQSCATTADIVQAVEK